MNFSKDFLCYEQRARRKAGWKRRVALHQLGIIRKMLEAS